MSAGGCEKEIEVQSDSYRIFGTAYCHVAPYHLKTNKGGPGIGGVDVGCSKNLGTSQTNGLRVVRSDSVE